MEAGTLITGAEQQTLKALSVRQPWAWLIVYAGKDIENRSWATRFRGRFLVHASLGMTHDEYDDVEDWLDSPDGPRGRIALPPFHELQRGGIIGQATLVDCVSRSNSRWFFGPNGFVLRDAVPLPFRPVRGSLGFFKLAA